MTKKKEYVYFKKHKHGDEFPDDFWNYKINHITGYYVKPYRDEISQRVIRKYATDPKVLPKNTA